MSNNYSIDDVTFREELKLVINQSDRRSLNNVIACLHEGASPNTIFENGQSACHLAIQHNHLPILQVLVQYGADVSITDLWGDTLLHVAVSFNNQAIVSYLLQHNADLINVVNNKGYTPFFYALTQANYSMAKYLYDYCDYVDLPIRGCPNDLVEQFLYLPQLIYIKACKCECYSHNQIHNEQALKIAISQSDWPTVYFIATHHFHPYQQLTNIINTLPRESALLLAAIWQEEAVIEEYLQYASNRAYLAKALMIAWQYNFKEALQTLQSYLPLSIA